MSEVSDKKRLQPGPTPAFTDEKIAEHIVAEFIEHGPAKVTLTIGKKIAARLGKNDDYLRNRDVLAVNYDRMFREQVIKASKSSFLDSHDEASEASALRKRNALSRTGGEVERELSGVLGTPVAKDAEGAWLEIIQQGAGRVFDAALTRLNQPGERYGGLRGRMTLWAISREEDPLRDTVAELHRGDSTRILRLYALVFEHFDMPISRLPDDKRSVAIEDFMETVSATLDGMLIRADADGDAAQWRRRFSDFLVRYFIADHSGIDV